MKLSSILAVIMATMANATDTSFLRKSTKATGLGDGKPNGLGESSGHAGVIISMEGVTSQDGASNDVVAKCLVNAFNTIHQNAHDDFKLENAFVVNSIVVPPSSNNSTVEDADPSALNYDGNIGATQKKKKKKNQGSSYWWLDTGYHCRLCDPDNRLLSQVNFIENLVAKKDGNMHKALQAEFRNELKASGDAPFANVGRCEIDFTRPAVAAAVTTTANMATKARISSVGRRKPPQKDNPDAPSSGGYAGVILSVHRVKDSLDWNKDAIPNCLVTAYNKVNQKNDYTLETAFIQKSVSIPEAGDGGDKQLEDVDRPRRLTDYTYDVFWLWTGFHCNGNADCQKGPRQEQRAADDFDALTAFLAAQGADAHSSFQVEFCAELKQAGGPAMADIADCDVQFTYTSPSIMEAEAEEDVMLESSVMDRSSQEAAATVALQEPDKQTMTSQIQIFHVMGSEFDISGHQLLTTQAFLEAFNLINAGGGVTVTAVDLLRRIDIPQDDDDNNDDDAAPDNGGDDDGPFDRLWWASVTITGMGPKKEDLASSASSALEMLTSDPAAHKAFEQLFYLKLKNSRMLAYADISACDISFSYPPTLSSSFEDVNVIALQE